ncbi:Lrp/AsnC family leucine-responsive transcriptional regulator [Lachnospiraceae bacterium PF1-21]|uniref:Lrp/AsnC family transcriptional regulator n=1 Tax=Ohessyouella blattaphilus TaxID=2949333 RepID=A0ABT1EJS2_9FIRM|nr:Lrp/AsnC family transcriptional regulator [Ohessyouella blattaphilus]MCP1110949.1 Lrp/AsnC family transcriptional regulator [Ohessyouella blattaphilus]MCR8564343.1 Lrp/AsnC family transcriptional regulator [Ohessyouella blattaphilus]MDL2251125.1 Lrp/AsnC family transcriptional regulator [Lachnospiraceae bacterium OttesenSCG-928-J05]
MPHKIDDIDKKILAILYRDGRAPVKEIAKAVFLSAPATATRIERLEKNGIISGYQARINPHAFGFALKAFINLEVAPGEKQEFYDLIRDIPNVISCDSVTGEYSMLIQAFFRDTEELDNFTGLLQRFGRTKTVISFSTPIEHGDFFSHEKKGD